MIGGQGPYIEPHHFQASLAYRGLASRYHWRGYERARDIKSGVRNHQQIFDFIGTYQISKQLSVSVSLPVFNGSFYFLTGNPPVPADPLHNRPRQQTAGRGIGDMTIVGRSWLFPTEKARSGNLSLGFGFNIPTGNDQYMWTYPLINGTRPTRKPVDISIQPGSGAFGLIGEVIGFKQVKRVTFFGSGIYLAYCENGNGVPSTVQGLLGPEVARSVLPKELTNSTPDLYVGEVGIAVPVPKIRGLTLTGAARIEGSPPVNMFGGTAGFRRPGFVLFGEPGMAYHWGKNTVTFSVPLRGLVNTQVVAVDHRHADATIPNWIILANYIRRF